MLQKNLSYHLIAFSKKWSWSVAFILLCAICLEKALQENYKEYEKLETMRISLEKQIQSAAETKDELVREINSQSDPAWVELTLMKKLGLVPEGQKKIIFIGKEE